MSKHKTDKYRKYTIAAAVTFALAILCFLFIVLFCKKGIMKNNYVYAYNCLSGIDMTLYDMIDRMEKYSVYKLDSYIIVEKKMPLRNFVLKNGYIIPILLKMRIYAQRVEKKHTAKKTRIYMWI